MRVDRALDDVLETRGHVQILRALVDLPGDASASARDLARRAGVAHTTGARALRSLADSRIVHAQRAGRADLYRLNQGHALAPASEYAKRAKREMRTAADLARIFGDRTSSESKSARSSGATSAHSRS